MTPIALNTTIRPGLLVAIKTSIKGNVSYTKTAASVRTNEDGSEVAEWDTERHIKNAAEQKLASKARSEARSKIASVCSVTDFGYLCPITFKPELDKAIVEAKAICDKFNESSEVTEIRFAAVTGTIAQDDYQAVRAIRREVTELLTDMEEGLKNLDVSTAREAASRAKQLGQMLTPDAQVRVEIAIKAVRENARKLAAKADANVADVDRRVLVTLAEARTAFLDIDMDDAEVAMPETTAPVLDLTDDTKVAA
jgi:ElaB/YqjD/DUF883 family membrane-anchored ribosome-binding protein